MNKAIIIADCAKPPSRLCDTDNVIELCTYGKNRNVRIEIDALRIGLLDEIPKRLDDLISIAAVVYSADTRVKRGTEKDVFSTKWNRDIKIFIPVHDQGFWDTDIKNDLEDTLSFLTGDNWWFSFVKKDSSVPVQRFIFKERIGDLPKVSTVISFSGGVDSLAAVINTSSSGHKPLLISHRAAPIISSRQTNLVQSLRDCYNEWPFPHISMWLNRKGGSRTKENTQRSRSFVYSCLSAVSAIILNVNDIMLCDNGIVSINLPQSSQTIGTQNTRSTHPKFINKVQNLFQKVSGNKKLSVKNALVYNTKKETMEIILNSGHPELLQETNSCAHTEGMTTYQPHCGTCSQCIDRRFSSIAANMNEYDLKERYQKDIFLDELDDGHEKTYVENYVRFATILSKIPSAEAFFSEFPQLIECLDDNDIEGSAKKIFDMYQRHQVDINKVLENKIIENAKNLVAGNLPESSLLKIVATGKHLSNVKMGYVKKLKKILSESIPIAFNSQDAKNEIQVQDVGHSILTAAKERLHRESPQIPFSVVTTKPDFSKQEENGDQLFLEFKHIKERKRLNSIITEMTSRVTIYRTQKAQVLFVVHDPSRAIVDDKEFINSFEKYTNIFVALVR